LSVSTHNKLHMIICSCSCLCKCAFNCSVFCYANALWRACSAWYWNN